MKPSRNWSQELTRMLHEQEPESLHLDYKQREALLPQPRGGTGIDKDKRATDGSKDVASFLNSDGGALIYGIRQDRSGMATEGAPLPLSNFDPAIDGYYPGEVTKETLEHIIRSAIQPPPPADLYHIEEVQIQGRVVLVVDVSRSMQGAFQAKDLRYYERIHFGNEAMPHYRIELIRNRAMGPELVPQLGLNQFWHQAAPTKIPVAIHVGLLNRGQGLAMTALLEVGVVPGQVKATDSKLLGAGNRKVEWIDNGAHIGEVSWYQWPWTSEHMGNRYRPLFSTVDPIYGFRIDLDYSPPFGVILWRVQAPGMLPKEGASLLVEREGQFVLTRADWEVHILPAT